jgi:hypothetical protein
MTKSFSSVYKYQDSGSGQIRFSGTNILSPGMAKIAPWCLARRDNSLAKAPGQTTGGQRHQRLLQQPATVSIQAIPMDKSLIP